ncbi:bifunctional nicotinamidase/pyrazinamidase [soil metagenome]
MRFVVVVDMQRDFVVTSGALPVPDAEAIVAPMQAWLAALDPADVAGVLMTFDTHMPAVYARSPESSEFPIHCVQGTAGWESVLDFTAIHPAIPVRALDKGVFDMWAEPGLTVRDMRGEGSEDKDRDAFFDALAGSVDTVTVVGVAADYCVRWAVEGLIARGYAVEIPASLTRGIVKGADVVCAELGAAVTLIPSAG